MAYIVNPDLQKDPNEVTQQTGPKLLTGAPGSDGGTNPLTTSNASSGAYTPASNTPSQSGSFTNLKQYLDTNQPQATQLGQKLGDNITQKANDATAAIGNASNTFRNTVDQNTVKLDPTLQNRAVNDSANFVNSSDFDKFAKILSGQYTGPAALSQTDAFTDVNKKVTDADTAAQLGQTAGGRIELLRQLPGSTPYARGGLSLDQMLVQNTDPARQAVEQGVETAKPVKDTFSTTQTQLADVAKNAVTQSQQAAQAAKQGILDAQQSLRDQLTARVQQQQEAARAQQDAVRMALMAMSSGNPGSPMGNSLDAISTALKVAAVHNPQLGAWGQLGQSVGGFVTHPDPAAPLSPEQLAAMGLSADQLNNLVNLNNEAKAAGATGINFVDYLHASDPNAIGVGNVASADDAAKYAALAKMAGNPDGFIPTALNSTAPLFNFDPAMASTTLSGQIADAKARKEAAAQNAAAIAAGNANAAKVSGTVATVGGAIAGAQIGAAVSDGVGAVVGAIGGAIFCFAKGTPMLMQDGSVKNVEDIKIGDEMLLGGTVTAAGQALEQHIYKYHNTYVAGNHTIFGEDGVWRKVADCADAEKVELEGAAIVCPIANENHLMVTSDFISADFAEVDNPGWDMNGKQRLDYLNMWTERNEALLTVMKTVFPHKYEDENTEIHE